MHDALLLVAGTVGAVTVVAVAAPANPGTGRGRGAPFWGEPFWGEPFFGVNRFGVNRFGVNRFGAASPRPTSRGGAVVGVGAARRCGGPAHKPGWG